MSLKITKQKTNYKITTIKLHNKNVLKPLLYGLIIRCIKNKI